MSIHIFKDEIVIEDETFNAQIAELIADKLNFNDQLKKITFTNVIFSSDSIASFCNRLDFRCRNLQKIMFQFYDTKLSTIDIKYLSNIFPFFTKIHFQNAGLNSDSINIIAEYISKNPENITTLHLENNRFGIEGHHALLDALTKNDIVDKVFLKNTHDYRNGEDFTSVYEHLSHMLTVNSSIKILGLQESYVNYPLVELLFKGIENNRGLHKIDLGNNFFIHDRSGKYTKKFATAVKMQGLINQFTNEASKNPHINEVKSIIQLREVVKERFFFAVTHCDLETLQSLFSENKVNKDWTTSDKGYNALHLIASSTQPIAMSEAAIKLLYQYNFKELLYKRCARSGAKLQPMELAREKARFNIADLLYSTRAFKLAAPVVTKVSNVTRKAFSTNYKSCGLFSKSLTDTTEFPSLSAVKQTLKG
ncbi:MAG: hypothetical protein K2X50_00970 [Gammaproteobacteria bacterium]|nr:hypothetical protein [Gammaproteobacteria bacterium]